MTGTALKLVDLRCLTKNKLNRLNNVKPNRLNE